jgi:hypothetical protein
MRSPFIPTTARLASAEGAAPPQVVLDGLEITQAIQDMQHSVPLIANKQTVVRAYLSISSTANPITVRGELVVRRTANGLNQTIASLNAVTLDPSQAGQLQVKREDVDMSLNFLLPTTLIVAGLLFVQLNTVTDVQMGSIIPLTNAADSELVVEFQTTPPLRIKLIGFSYTTGNPPVTHTPSARDFALVFSWLQRAYPVAEVIGSQLITPANFSPPFTLPDGADAGKSLQANAQLAAIRNLDISNGTDVRTHYYGLVSDGGDPASLFMRGRASGIPLTPDPTTVASGPTGAADFGWDRDGSYGDWYTGHELAHTLGRFHPGFCAGNSSNDPSYPFPNGQLSDSTGRFVGFDVGAPELGLPMKALPGVVCHDVMTYCDNQWLCSYTYDGIRQRLIAEDTLGSQSSSGQETSADNLPMPSLADKDPAVRFQSTSFINVVATVNLTEVQGEILYVSPVVAALVPRTPTTSEVLIRVQTASGQVLHDYPVEVKRSSCCEGEDAAGDLIDAIIPLEPEAKRLELLVDGTTVDVFQASTQAPVARNLRATGTVGAAGVAFRWDEVALPDSNITYTVQVSTDEGKTWQVLVVGSKTPNAVVDRNQFHDAKTVMLRVVATDGFTSTTTTSAPLPADRL